MAFNEVGIELEFKGVGIDEKGFVKSCSNPNYQIEIGQEVLAVDPRYFRPTEVELLIGDATKAKEKLGWTPEFQLSELVQDMMKNDLRLMEKQIFLKEGGYTMKNYFE
jgi:GDPmannose 4,6-dehydratase